MAGAVWINRAILRSDRIAQRRSLFEALGIIAYATAVALAVFSILNWTSQPYFVAGCTAIWILFSLIVVTRLWWTNRHRDELEIPDAWDEPFSKNLSEEPTALKSRAATDHSDHLSDVNAIPSSTKADVGTHAAAMAESLTAEHARTQTTAADTQAAGINKIGRRTMRLQQYRQERLSRYRQKRRNCHTVTGNLAIYRKLSGNPISNGS